MNRGIDNGKDLPSELLTVILYSLLHVSICAFFTCAKQEFYENVKKEEFKVPDSEGGGGLAETFFNPEKEGWLTKEGKVQKTSYGTMYMYLHACEIEDLK